MKKLLQMVCFGVVFVVSSPMALANQQTKMKGCNAEARAGGMKGAERKAFMKKCLKKDYVLKTQVGETAVAPPSKPASSAKTGGAPSPQQDRMKSCSADAKSKGLKGEERKTFMSSCLHG